MNDKKKLQRPLSVKCFKCTNLIEVKWNTGRGEYSQKNNWYYWTEQEENQGKYICNKDLGNMYRKNRWEYLENITNLTKKKNFKNLCLWEEDLKTNS